MGLKMEVSVTAGTGVKESVEEAMRLAKMLGVLVTYEFSDVRVGVSEDGLMYALEKGSILTAQWFMDHYTS